VILVVANEPVERTFSDLFETLKPSQVPGETTMSSPFAAALTAAWMFG